MGSGHPVTDDHTSTRPLDKRASNRRVLVVEDHRDTAVVLQRLLEMDGYSVTVADTAASAISAVLTAGEPFAVVVTDLLLPGGDGGQVVSALRKQGDVPAIAVTGMASADLDVTAREMGFDIYLCKPLRFEDLRAAIAGCIEQ